MKRNINIERISKIIRQYIQSAESVCKPFADSITRVMQKYGTHIDVTPGNFRDVVRCCEELLDETYRLDELGIHQITSLGSTEIIDEYEPLEEGLDLGPGQAALLPRRAQSQEPHAGSRHCHRGRAPTQAGQRRSRSPGS